jgi:hypothetical protein
VTIPLSEIVKDLNISYQGVFKERARRDKPFEMCNKTMLAQFANVASKAALSTLFGTANVLYHTVNTASKAVDAARNLRRDPAGTVVGAVEAVKRYRLPWRGGGKTKKRNVNKKRQTKQIRTRKVSSNK